MTNSTFAWIFIIASSTDTYLNDCQTDCFQQSDAPARFSVQFGDTLFQEEDIGEELFVSYDLPKRYGSLQPTAGISVTSDNDVWVGAGAKWSTERTVGGPIFIEASLMPGVYMQGDGPDLGFPVQWRGALGAGVKFGDVGSLSVFLDHRSNADLSEVNPGLETVGIRFSYQLE
ncbi:acyloxyacyl hydrolase [Yoonia algicola]|uniref:Acyloxyacyl hydrolase n=1 Tax=Yoonia algicola TaxID=3137368 RepID=A0AAN0M3W2_9RHOB